MMPRLLMLSLLALLSNTALGRSSKPNFVFILVDDLGYMDIHANNPDTFYETPNVDRLAAEGMRFTQAYAANPVCSPTRYSIMTGKHPSRVDATNFFSGKREGRFQPAPLNDVMPLEEVTLAEALKPAAYRTAFLGKWHLGPTERYWPEHQGFDMNIGGHHRGSPSGGYFAPWNNPRLENGPDGEFLTKRLADEAIRILETFQDGPFLLYVSWHTVHTPLQAPAALIEEYKRKAEQLGLTVRMEFGPEEQVWPTERRRQVRILQGHATYAAMVESMDTHTGRILDKLHELGLEENTVVFYFSDNGGLATSEGLPTSNLPLRGGKGWLYEGGIREPAIIRWPGVTQPGSVCDHPIVSMDFYPTILEIAGLPSSPEQHLDGVSLVGLLKGCGSLAPRALYWHYPHYSNQGGFPGAAVREGDWKLIERFEDGRIHLYNLKEDVGEQHDRSAEMPERVAALRSHLHARYRAVDAKFLQPKEGRQPWRPED